MTTTPKSRIDRSGTVLADRLIVTATERSQLEAVFDNFRGEHLSPLSEVTLLLQAWLKNFGSRYYIAQRLKRKPQIIRKLKRLPGRLTQLQDIGGCRIVVESNADVDKLIGHLRREDFDGAFKISRLTDYREKGREDSGYRAVHVILEIRGYKIELQVRSRIQHYWAESIERTSVIYGHYLKELEGDALVLSYFKLLSDFFFEIESDRKPDSIQKIKLGQQRDTAEKLIKGSDKFKIFDSYVNDDLLKTLVETERGLGSSDLHNWLIVFNWNEGAFVTWDKVVRDPVAAMQKYIEYENQFPAEEGFEVVLVGASEVATIRETHSHYFGIESRNSPLGEIDESIAGFSHKMDIDIGARKILSCLVRRKYWGKKTITALTLKNHFCKDVYGFDLSLDLLIRKGLVTERQGDGLALDIKRKREIEAYL